LHPDVAAVLKGKRVLLFQALLREAHYDDPTLIHEVVSGFRLVGTLPSSPEFPEPRLRAATKDMDELWRYSKWAQVSALSSTGPSGDPALDEAVYLATEEEVQKGWLLGPYSAEQLCEKVGRLWVPSRRFGVVQGGKVRPIDDFSVYGINEAVSSSDKLDLGGLD
jgi:hypothetical protein